MAKLTDCQQLRAQHAQKKEFFRQLARARHISPQAMAIAAAVDPEYFHAQVERFGVSQYFAELPLEDVRDVPTVCPWGIPNCLWRKSRFCAGRPRHVDPNRLCAGCDTSDARWSAAVFRRHLFVSTLDPGYGFSYAFAGKTRELDVPEQEYVQQMFDLFVQGNPVLRYQQQFLAKRPGTNKHESAKRPKLL